MAGQVNIGGNTASVQLTGNDAITADQEIGFPDTGGDSAVVIVTPTTQDIETTGDFTAADGEFTGTVTAQAFLRDTLQSNGGINLSAGKCFLRQDGANSNVFGVFQGGDSQADNMTFSVTGKGGVNASYLISTMPDGEDNANWSTFAGRDGSDGNKVTCNITADGKISIIGTSTAVAPCIDLHADGYAAFYRKSTTATNYIIRGFSDVGGERQEKFKVQNDGTLTISGKFVAQNLSSSGAISFNIGWSSASNELVKETSSIKTKTNVETADPDICLNIVKNSRPVWYRSNQPADNPEHSYWGFIAEEVDKVAPRLTCYDANGEPGGVAYARYTPVLVSVLQQALTRIEDLEARISTLEGGAS